MYSWHEEGSLGFLAYKNPRLPFIILLKIIKINIVNTVHRIMIAIATIIEIMHT